MPSAMRTVRTGRVLRIQALRDGGWVARSETGAIAGSPGAWQSIGTTALRGTENLYFTGNLLWDAFEAPDLVAKALGGELVRPPGL